MPLLLFIPLKDGHWIYLLPFLKEGWIPVVTTVKSTIIAFLGFEFAFVLYPYLTNKSAAKKGIIIANMITLCVYLQVTFVSFVYFSPDGITKFLWPTLSLVTPFHFSFLERFEIIFYHFISSLFSILVFLIFSLLQMESINYLTKRESITCLDFIIRMHFRSILLYPFLLPNKCVARILGTASYFIVFLFPVVFLLYMTLYQHWKRRKI